MELKLHDINSVHTNGNKNIINNIFMFFDVFVGILPGAFSRGGLILGVVMVVVAGCYRSNYRYMIHDCVSKVIWF